MLKKQIFFFVSFFFLPFMSCQLMEYDSKDKLFPGVSRIYTDTKDGSSVYVQLNKKITNADSAQLVSAFTVCSPGDIHVVTNVAFVDTTTLRLFLSNAITSHRQVTLSYESKKELMMSDGIALPSFSSINVENNLTGLLIWNNMDSLYDVNNSVVGGDVVFSGSPFFTTGKFGDSMICTNTANYATISLPNMMYRGTIAFWVAPQFDSAGNGISEAHPSFVEKTPWIDYPNDTGLGITYNNNPASDSYKSIIFQIRGPKDGGQEYATVVSGALSFTANQWMHVTAVWDISGIDGTSDTMRLYIDGVQVGSTNGAFPLFERRTFSFGRNSFGNRSAHSKLDNLQIYDYAKTDFNIAVEGDWEQGLVLWNRMGSLSEITNSEVGPGLIAGGGPQKFVAAKFGNGVQLLSNDTKVNGVSIKSNVVSRANFTIEFWYTRVESMSDGDTLTLIQGRDTSSSTTPCHQTINLSIVPNWGAVPGVYVLMADMRFSDANSNSVQPYHDFGSLANLEAAFPIGTPVHIAVTKRNSSGEISLYLNGQKLSISGYRVSLPYATSDTSVIAGKSGFFPSRIQIGEHFWADGNFPARGIIDNIKVYNLVKTSFDIVNE